MNISEPVRLFGYLNMNDCVKQLLKFNLENYDNISRNNKKSQIVRISLIINDINN